MKEQRNTVPADNQMMDSDVVSFLGNADAPLKILILGNSITRHAPSAEIDWHFDWGMAASAPEKDYVHRLHAMLEESGRDSYMMIRQASHWERHFKEADCLFEYEKEKAFHADIVILRLGENVNTSDLSALQSAAETLMDHITPAGAFSLITTSFWKNAERDRVLIAAAKGCGCPCVDIGCTDEKMMALGKFSHHGVSIHPGDLGMEMIAKKLFDAIQRLS